MIAMCQFITKTLTTQGHSLNEEVNQGIYNDFIFKT